jgi:hypothetical protein
MSGNETLGQTKSSKKGMPSTEMASLFSLKFNTSSSKFQAPCGDHSPRFTGSQIPVWE